MTSAGRPRPLVMATGGTFAWSTQSRMDHGTYSERGRPGLIEGVLSLLPELADIADVHAVDVVRTGSTSMREADLLRVKEALESDDTATYDGVVITHGTATLEETAFFLCVATRPVAPVVLVGAQRPPGLLGSDALMNLYQAVRALADPVVRAGGPLVCINGELHDARTVTKAHTTALNAFASPGGPIGRVYPDGRVVVSRTNARPFEPVVLPAGIEALPRVEIAVSYLGSDGAGVRALASTRPAGIVSAGFAPGMTTPGEHAALVEALADGITVVQTARPGDGPVVLTSAARAAGIIPADGLRPQQARILTAVGLAAGLPRDELAARFAAI